jgi:hypothetical protein
MNVYRTLKLNNFICCSSFCLPKARFAKLRKATVGFVKPVCPSAWKNSAHAGRIFTKFGILSIFRKSVEKIQVSLKSHNNKGCFIWRPLCIYDHISLNSSQNEKYFTKICRETQNTYLMFNNFFPSKIVHWWDNVEKYCGAGQATDDNMAHAHCVLDT